MDRRQSALTEQRYTNSFTVFIARIFRGITSEFVAPQIASSRISLAKAIIVSTESCAADTSDPCDYHCLRSIESHNVVTQGEPRAECDDENGDEQIDG